MVYWCFFLDLQVAITVSGAGILRRLWLPLVLVSRETYPEISCPHNVPFILTPIVGLAGLVNAQCSSIRFSITVAFVAKHVSSGSSFHPDLFWEWDFGVLQTNWHRIC